MEDLTGVVISYEMYGEFRKLHLKLTTSVRFCLSYDHLKWDFIAFKMNTFSKSKCIVVTDVVNGITCTRQSVITLWPYDFCDMTLSTE